MVIRATLATNMAMAMMGFASGGFFKLLVGTVLRAMLIVGLHRWWYILPPSVFPLRLALFWRRQSLFTK